MGYICTRCGGTNVACEAIVNPNTGKIIDYFDGSFMHAICAGCENEVIISNVEGVKHEIDLRFHEFVERTGKEPEYVECQIVRKETGDEQRKTIKHKKIRQAEAEKKIMLCVFDYGLSTDNVIYYSHTNTLSFNWDSYEKKITQEEFDDFVKNVDRSKLPEGIKFELK